MKTGARHKGLCAMDQPQLSSREPGKPEAAAGAPTGEARPAGKADGGPSGDGPILELADRLRQAQETLKGRPRLSIRQRLFASLALCFLLCTAFSLGSFEILRELTHKLRLVQMLERLDDRVLRVRALADEGRLSAPELELVLQRADQALDLLKQAPSAAEADGDLLPLLEREAETWRRLLESATPADGRAGGTALLTGESAAQVRATATEASRRLTQRIRRERSRINTFLRAAEIGPLALLAVLFVLFALITYAFTRALVMPIHRFKGYTSRIAGGDFSFIRPARSYRDEFSDLAMAVNQMLAELRVQQSRMVQGAKLAAVGTLTSGIAHELNNPLNNISITTEALMEGLKGFNELAIWQHLQDIYFEAERASEIVKRLLDFTRTERPQMALLDLREVLESTVRLVQNEMSINNVVLEMDIPSDLPRIRAVLGQLRQVFVNLLLNSVQATPTGGKISICTKIHGPERVCVEIGDSGSGIPADILPHVFDPFFTTKEPGRGTGLGLSVSLGIVRSFGGDMQVASEVGSGTTVHVCLPKGEAV
jgi:two-component system NtrC family sensor kinase